jgi:hypothetical protein
MQTYKKLTLIALEDNSYHIMVPAVFDHSLRVNLIIDTGASKSIFDLKLLKHMALEIEEVDNNLSSGINSYIQECFLAKFQGFSIGKLKVEPFTGILMDLSHVNQLYKKMGQLPIAGLLGCDFLYDYKATISFTQNKLILNF